MDRQVPHTRGQRPPVEIEILDFHPPSGRLLEFGDHALTELAAEPGRLRQEDRRQRQRHQRSGEPRQNAQRDSRLADHWNASSA